MLEKLFTCLEPFKGLFESLPFCARVEMLLVTHIHPIAWPYRTWTKRKLFVKLPLQRRTFKAEREREKVIFGAFECGGFWPILGFCCQRMPEVEPTTSSQDISEPVEGPSVRDLAWDVGPLQPSPKTTPVSTHVSPRGEHLAAAASLRPLFLHCSSPRASNPLFHSAKLLLPSIQPSAHPKVGHLPPRLHAHPLRKSPVFSRMHAKTTLDMNAEDSKICILHVRSHRV